MSDDEEDYPGGVPGLQRTNGTIEVVGDNQLQPGQFLQNNQIMSDDQVGGRRRRRSRRRSKSRRRKSRRRRRRSRRRRH